MIMVWWVGATYPFVTILQTQTQIDRDSPLHDWVSIYNVLEGTRSLPAYMYLHVMSLILLGVKFAPWRHRTTHSIDMSILIALRADHEMGLWTHFDKNCMKKLFWCEKKCRIISCQFVRHYCVSSPRHWGSYVRKTKAFMLGGSDKTH